VEVSELLEQFGPWLQKCDGVTISGGEPFEQPQALERLLGGIREQTAVDILVYSGLPLEELANLDAVTRGLIDCLISDPFDANVKQSKYLRGSDNQRMTCLTPLGRQVFGSLDRDGTDADRQLDVMFDRSGEVWFAGIPSRGDMQRLKSVLAAQGTSLTTTEARA
jgi:anaerobic ribonucleoside-triphosphate reductase activating protein